MRIMFLRSLGRNFNLRQRSGVKTCFVRSRSTTLPADGLVLEDFMTKNPKPEVRLESHPYIPSSDYEGNGRKVYIDVRGCQMNVSDAEVVWAVLQKSGYSLIRDPDEAQVHLIMTCSIREGAENKIWKKLQGLSRCRKRLRGELKIGILGCMAERLKDGFKGQADIVAGPDAYRDLPRLLAVAEGSHEAAINVLLSRDETYADVIPVQLHENAVTAFVSIQRGCDNMCTYCIVPFTRGRERSRPIASILDEVRHLAEKGVKEVTLLGQNVNSYRDLSESSYITSSDARSSNEFKTVYKPKVGGARFADLLHRVSDIDPQMRIRFTSPHPKDFPAPVLQLIKDRPNICKHIHLPAQSGSTKVLEAMRRGYSRESYIDLVENIRHNLPRVSLSSDFIAGFCGESEQDFEETLSLIKIVGYNKMFVFPYSMREKTSAHRKLRDDVPEDVKQERFKRLFNAQREESAKQNAALVGTKQVVLIEGNSKRSQEDFQGRADSNNKVIFPKDFGLKPGNYCVVNIMQSNSETLKGIIEEPTTLSA